MKYILLTQNKKAKVDNEDYEYLNQFNWHYNSRGYAVRTIRKDNKRIAVRIHRILTNAPDNMEVDHINGDRLDNRKVNLRLVTSEQNSRNRKKNKNSFSSYKGVKWYPNYNKWSSHINFKCKRYFLGYFINEKDAAIAYNNAAVKYHGEFAKLNKI